MGNNTFIQNYQKPQTSILHHAVSWTRPVKLIAQKRKYLPAFPWKPLLVLQWWCQIHHKSQRGKSPGGECHQPLSIICEPSALAGQKNHLAQHWHSHSHQCSEPGTNSSSCSALENRPFSLVISLLVQDNIMSFCGFYLIVLLGQSLFNFNWGLLNLPLVYGARSVLDWWIKMISPELRVTQVEQL